MSKLARTGGYVQVAMLVVAAFVVTANTSVLGESAMDKYFVPSEQPRWAIPEAGGSVVGSQNFWYVSPHDVMKGSFSMAVSDVREGDGSEFLIQPLSMWGKYTYRLYDTVRCLQYVRCHADELGLDKKRVASWGGSAGGAAAAWIALRDDLADPESKDPIARESSRVTCAVPEQAQTSLDPKQMQEWIPGITYGAHIFLNPSPKGDEQAAFAAFLAKRDELLPYIREFSAYEWASKDDPPVLLCCGGQDDVIPPKDSGNATHHPQFSRRLSERLKELGVESYWYADNVTCENPRYHRNPENFLRDKLLGGQGQ